MISSQTSNHSFLHKLHFNTSLSQAPSFLVLADVLSLLILGIKTPTDSSTLLINSPMKCVFNKQLKVALFLAITVPSSDDVTHGSDDYLMNTVTAISSHYWKQ